MLFTKIHFFLLLLSSVSGVAHFIHASTVCHYLFFVLNALLSLQTKNNHFGLQTYSKILIEGILLKMLRNKRELYLEQAIWFYFVWPVRFAPLTQTQIHLHAEQENFWTWRRSICSLNYCALDIKSINRKSFVAWSCFCHTEKIKLVQSVRWIFFMTASCLNCFTWEMYFRGTFIKKCCVKFVYFQMGSESKENRLSCQFVHPSSVYEKFQLQLYTAELRLRTASWLLCDFLNQKYEANL